MGAYAYRCFQLKKWKRPDRISQLLAGLLLATVGLLLFSLVETEANYRVRTIYNVKFYDRKREISNENFPFRCSMSIAPGI